MATVPSEVPTIAGSGAAEIDETAVVAVVRDPNVERPHPVDRVAIVTVSYNTLELTALLLWSLHRVLDWPDVEIIVVDNGSTDGSRELLADARDAGLCVLLVNDRNVGHGCALNQALSFVSSRPRRPDRVWILDSDCVVARASVIAQLFSREDAATAAVVGEPQWDPWHGRERFALYSLLVDPAQVLRPDVALFEDGGDPAFSFLASAERAGLQLPAFPFADDGFVIHLGRASLSAVVARDERDHPLFGWAVGHHEPHYGGIAGARETHDALFRQFRAEVGAPPCRRLRPGPRGAPFAAGSMTAAYLERLASAPN